MQSIPRHYYLGGPPYFGLETTAHAGLECLPETWPKPFATGAMKALTKNLRRRAAIVIAVAYAFCVLAPTAALAVIASPTVFHCIGDLSAKSNAKQVSETHKHADGSAHHHAQSSPDDGHNRLGGVRDHHSGQDKSDAGNCCGLFCVSAIAHDPGMTFGLSEPASAAPSGVVTGLIGRAPGPLHRPPIT